MIESGCQAAFGRKATFGYQEFCPGIASKKSPSDLSMEGLDMFCL